MGRGIAYAYKSGSRPYGQPGGDKNFRDASPRPEAVGKGRNVARLPEMKKQAPILEEASKCSALTRSGDPCKGRPVMGGDLCVFHRE